MEDFFESIASFRSYRQLRAAWVIEGEGAGAKALFARDGEHYTQICRDSAFSQACAAQIAKLSCGHEGVVNLGERKIFVEQIHNGRRLVICGAGHVSMPAIRIAVMVGFEVTVIEDRTEFAQKAEAAGAHHVICKPFEEALEEIESDPGTAFVIMTRAHSHDIACLRKILNKPYSYTGMMGSRSRTGLIRSQLLEEGFDPLKVGQLHMPIGLPIGSRTPEEIAVSVMAELIQVINVQNAGEGFPEGMAEELAGLKNEKNPSVVLTMIVEKNGEAPRRPGTKMLVRKDGSFLGTVGGGYAEARILESASEMIREGSMKPRLVRISMTKGTMHCGGEITVWLLPL